MDVIQEPLSEYGFVIGWRTSTDPSGKVLVRCRLTYLDGHYEETDPSASPPDAKGGKNPTHAIASSMTLLQRYTLLAMLGIATADMEEDSRAAESPPTPRTDAIDPLKNILAVKTIRKLGLDLADAEKSIGKKSAEWTARDLADAKRWIKAQKKPVSSPPPEEPDANGELTEEEERQFEQAQAEQQATLPLEGGE
jgi:hypothetical protein